jgi:hypothetical protein
MRSWIFEFRFGYREVSMTKVWLLFLITSSSLISAAWAQEVTNSGPGGAAIGINYGTVNTVRVGLSPQERGERILSFLKAKDLPIPGNSYGDIALMSTYGVKPSGMNLSNPILSGSFQTLASDNTPSPMGYFVKTFLKRNGQVIGAMITQTCVPNAGSACLYNYNDWIAWMRSTEGNLQETELKLGGAAAGPFQQQNALKQSYVYDGQWRLYVDRLDNVGSSLPATINLLIVKD